MRSNRELYQAAFSKLHASETLPVLEGRGEGEGKRYRHRGLRKPAAVCLAAVGILLAAATITFAMTGEGPMKFFKSFFRNADSPAAMTVNGTYVEVKGQSVECGDVRIEFEGYSYTRDTLLAKFRITSGANENQKAENEKPSAELETYARKLRFMADAAGSASTNWETGADGSVEIAVRMGLDWNDQEEDFTVSILVWGRETGMKEPIGIFTVGKPSAITRLVLEPREIPHCRQVVLSMLNVKLDFDNSVSGEENNPVETMVLNMKDGTALSLYSKGTGETDSIVSEISFGWTEEEDSTMAIGFSRVLELDEVRTVTINGEEYDVETQFQPEAG